MEEVFESMSGSCLLALRVSERCLHFFAGTMMAAQYLACLCDIAACLSGSSEVAELAHCTDNIAQVCLALLTHMLFLCVNCTHQRSERKHCHARPDKILLLRHKSAAAAIMTCVLFAQVLWCS